MQRAYDAMRGEILKAAALVEALIDFGEDQGIDDHVWFDGELRDNIDTQIMSLTWTTCWQLKSESVAWRGPSTSSF